MESGFRELFRRYKHNPIITKEQWPYPANAVFNAGATLLPNGDTVLLVRVEDRRGISHLAVARSKDGINDWDIDRKPTFTPNPGKYPEEIWGIEDPRIVYIPALEKYAITYTSYSRVGPVVSLAFTKDFKDFERYGAIMPPEDKDAALLPRKINGRWALLHRPIPASSSGAHIWISFSPDLKHWGDHTVVMEARQGAWWDATKIGLSPPPIETKEGWLILYHGVRHTPAGCLYRLGLALLDLEDPRKIIKRGDEWVFGPEESYEKIGDVDDVVFPCGFTLDEASGTIKLYYGAADTSIALALANVNELLDWLNIHG